jgi:2-desacetyl-2-hydroxyethyl bacteriochlorophyllide A dehydrogenase
MKCYYVEADWAPKKGYILSERELAERRAIRGDFVWKNVRASLKDVPIPEMKSDEVLIKVGACGVCGSDLHAIESDEEGYSVFASHTKFPVILGHEFSGEIVEIGKEVKGYKPGDIISVEQIRWCGRCRSCRTGMFNQCENLEEIGLSADGGFAEYAVVPEKYCCKINNIADLLGDKMAALEAGALAEPTCVAYSGMVVNAGGLKPGSNVAVFGAGPIGLAAISLARAFGAAQIFVFNTNPARAKLPKKIGADHVFDPEELARQGTSPGKAVLEMTDGIGAGMIVEATGNFSTVYPEIIQCMDNGARIVQLGIGNTPAAFDVGPFLRKNAHIVGSLGHAGSDIFPSVLRMMASGRIDMRKIITGRYSLDNAAEAIKASGDRNLGHGKVLVSQHYK